MTFTPALESEDEISRRDKELQDFMYKSSKRPRFFEEEFFREQFSKYGIQLLRRKVFHTSKNRLQPSDYKEYIEWICNNYKSFYAPDVEMRTHEEILREFQQFIEKYGSARSLMNLLRKSSYQDCIDGSDLPKRCVR